MERLTASRVRFWPFLAALLLPMLQACAGVPANEQGRTTLRIAVIGDRTGGHRPEVFEDALDKLDAMQPDLVLSVGDLVEGYTDDEAELARQWGEIEAGIARFGTRFHAVPGNHDSYSAASARMFRERRGLPYWSLLHEGVLILGLSTENPPIALPQSAIDGHERLLAALDRDPIAAQEAILAAYQERGDIVKPGDVAISEEQVAFFRQVLADNPSPRWTLVIMHKPAWAYDSEEFAELEAMLVDRPHSFIAGHEHYYDYENRDGRDYITMGTTGGIWLKDGPGRVDHILRLTLNDGAPSFMNIEIGGMFEKTGR